MCVSGLSTDWVRMLVQKERRSLGGLTNAITNALSITSSSSNQNLPVLKRQATIASCSGNWLSHFDWDGERCAPL